MLNKTEIVNNVTRKLYKVKFKMKKHSPELLVGAGVVGVVASTVLACKATLKVNQVLEESRTNIDKIHTAKETGVTEAGLEYSEDDAKKDLTVIYIQSGLKLAKLYAPAVAIGAASIGAIVGGHTILRKRNIALAAAYATIDKNFKDYRGRVVERFGEALDKELRYNIKSKEVEEIVVNEDGTESVVKKTVPIADEINEYSDYARFFDEACAGWTKDPEYNLIFLKQQQNYANDLLKRQGYLFLNDVYKMLGIDVTKAGQVVGWIYDEKNPIGDNYVDFGIYNINNERNRAFVNGRERNILLDFNVDGNILNNF